jgi:translation initiation factor 1 (eIF-1/SUI1)
MEDPVGSNEEGENKVIHISVKQLRGRKKVTYIKGGPEDKLDWMVSVLRKRYSCGGKALKEEQTVMLQGNYVPDIGRYIKEEMLKEYTIVLHGKKNEE